MFDSEKKLKEFMQWCQKNKIKAFKNSKIEFELSDLAFLPDTQDFSEIKLEDQKTFSDKDLMTREELEELEFWSANQTISKG